MKKLTFILILLSPIICLSETVELSLLNFTPSLYPSNEGFNSFMADLYEDGEITQSIHLWVADDDLLSFYYLVPVTKEPSYEDIISYKMLLESHDIGKWPVYVPLNLNYIATQLGFIPNEALVELAEISEEPVDELPLDGSQSYHDAYWEARASGKGMQEAADAARRYLRSQGIWDY